MKKTIHPLVLSVVLLLVIGIIGFVVTLIVARVQISAETLERNQARIDTALAAGQSDLLALDGPIISSRSGIAFDVRNDFAPDEYPDFDALGYGKKFWELVRYENGEWRAVPYRRGYEGVNMTSMMYILQSEDRIGINWTPWHGEIASGRYKAIFFFVRTSTAVHYRESVYEHLLVEFEITQNTPRRHA